MNPSHVLESKPRSRFYRRSEDGVVLEQIKQVICERASYGHRRVARLVNHDFEAGYNKKRICRAMKMYSLQLLLIIAGAMDGFTWAGLSRWLE